MRIVDYLAQNAERYPDKVAVVDDNGSLTYAQFYDAVLARAGQLTESGYRSRDCVVFRSSQTIPFLIDYFAVHWIGAVAIPLEQDVADAYVQQVEDEARKATIPKDVADVLYTTGTTGKSKGVMISHRAIVANAENLVDAQEFSHPLVFIICGPLNHIGSLSKVYPMLIVGGTILITKGIKDINAFYAALDYPCEKMATFLVPSMIRILLQLSQERLAQYAGKIDFIETGAAAISQCDMEQLCSTLPHSRLYNTYASTETGIICTHNFNSEKCIAGCLGRPMKNSNLHFSAEGKIVCTGQTLMSGYLNAEELTKTILYDDGVHTNDNGAFDAEGCLHLTGRDDDVINVGGYKVNPTEVENAAMSYPGIKDCICVSHQHPVLGSVLKLFVKFDDVALFSKKGLALHISSSLERYKVPQQYELVDKIERTFNGKLNRKFYRS